ncbi:MAG: helix-turn-helix transcriptional regulator [Clostridia bacterium]|nr:helix-turn-helix transcriptional regulator [Clostridia bacterium]
MLNETLKRLRHSESLTQKELAEKLSTSRQNISHLESGYIEPSIEMLRKYCTYFGVSADELLEMDALRREYELGIRVLGRPIKKK